MGVREITHWFSFKNSCVRVTEGISNSSGFSESGSIFFLHGRFGQAAVWNSLIEGLAAQYRCFSVDLPGFGSSFFTQDLAFSLLEHVQLTSELILRFTQAGEKVVLVGHDVGGAVAQLCALRQPHRISSLVLINSTTPIFPLMKLRMGFRGWFVFKKLLELLRESEKIEPSFERILTEPWKDKLCKASLTTSIRAIHSSWPRHYERQTWRKALEKMPQPVLLLWGRNDCLNSREVAVDLLKKLPDATFFLHEKCGHWPNLEQTQWVLEKTREFLFQHQLSFTVRKFL